MPILAVVIGIFLIIIVLVDAFETVVLPRRVTRRYRIVRLFYRVTWPAWSWAVRTLFPLKRRETLLSYYGPLSLPALLVLWALALLAGFGFLYWSQVDGIKTPEGTVSFVSCLYFSGTSFFTLGLGDITPLTLITRALSVMEAGMGFGFLAMVISYLPAINQAFSRREVNISLLDARAGSPPTAFEILRRNHRNNSIEPLTRFLHDWEIWSAELLEGHLSYPMLVYFRSQHDNQSWLAALTSILDACAFVSANIEGECERQASLTFAMARHTIVDLALVLYAAPREPRTERLSTDELSKIRSLLAADGLKMRDEAESGQRMLELQRTYEPYIHSLSERLLLPLPPWILKSTMMDNWQISAWSQEQPEKKHF
jgi:ion channel